MYELLTQPRPLTQMLASRPLRADAPRGSRARRNGRYPDTVPETRGERIIFAIGALAIATLVALIVLETATDRFKTRDTGAVAGQMTVAATTEAAASPSTASSTAPETTTAPQATTGETAAAPGRIATDVRLTLSAIADTWVEIRSGSAGGDVLYSGILPQGTAKHFRSTHLWASFGAAANLTARLNGKPLHLLPGTYSALVGARGLKPLVG
jgi:Domain of unknown function (DUF4115)